VDGWKLERIAWLDVETTGLDIERDLLLEVALIVTSGNLRELARESMVIAHTAEEIEAAFSLPGRDATYVRQMHTDNGLLEACQGPWAVSLEEADDRLFHLLGVEAQGCKGSRFPIGGCSVWLDRCMVRRDLPQLHEMIHARTVDASCLKVALVNWGGVDPKRAPQKASSAHRALADTEAAVKLARTMKLHLQRARRAIGQEGEFAVQASAPEHARSV